MMEGDPRDDLIERIEQLLDAFSIYSVSEEAGIADTGTRFVHRLNKLRQEVLDYRSVSYEVCELMFDGMAAEYVLSFLEYKPQLEKWLSQKNYARAGGIQSGKSRRRNAIRRYQIWQNMADEIWSRNPNFSKSAVARIVVRKMGGSLHSIRKVIIPPADN